MLVELLGREGGVTIEEMAVVLGWQEHTVRGVMSGALAKKFGLRIASEKVEGEGPNVSDRMCCGGRRR
jgi:hypothetical protein